MKAQPEHPRSVAPVCCSHDEDRAITDGAEFELYAALRSILDTMRLTARSARQLAADHGANRPLEAMMVDTLTTLVDAGESSFSTVLQRARRARCNTSPHETQVSLISQAWFRDWVDRFEDLADASALIYAQLCMEVSANLAVAEEHSPDLSTRGAAHRMFTVARELQSAALSSDGHGDRGLRPGSAPPARTDGYRGERS